MGSPNDPTQTYKCYSHDDWRVNALVDESCNAVSCLEACDSAATATTTLDAAKTTTTPPPAAPVRKVYITAKNVLDGCHWISSELCGLETETFLQMFNDGICGSTQGYACPLTRAALVR